LAPPLADAVPDLIQAARLAVRVLEKVDRILLITSTSPCRDEGTMTSVSAASRIYSAGQLISSVLLEAGGGTLAFQGRLPGSPDGQQLRRDEGDAAEVVPGVGVLVGTALLVAAGIALPTVAIELADAEPAPTDKSAKGSESDMRVQQLLHEAVTGPDRVGLLVIADGSGNRGPDSPGGGFEPAEAFDHSLGSALASGDALELGRIVLTGQAQASQLLWSSGPALSALARLAPAAAESKLLYADAPFGVGYLVSTWLWD